MYDKALVSGSAATLATLPVTGFSVVWFVIAGFALLMAGGALLRITPRKHS
ncbi:MAG TPA: LPXTG cell wall anchor domain-containing protein [Acidimicrobiales bacterium]|nr:LPXTG cell wall anchor domain-containing protein [Acidimicrobiales bacterium]